MLFLIYITFAILSNFGVNMKKILLISLLGLVLAGCQRGPSLESSLKEGRELLIIDVRSQSEYKDGWIPGAINIPHKEISEESINESKDLLIYTYCKSGIRSAKAKDTLEELGYTNVINYGSIGNWSGQLSR